MRLGVAAEQFDLEQPGVLGIGDAAPSRSRDLDGIDALDENVVARCEEVCGDGVCDEVAGVLNAGRSDLAGVAERLLDGVDTQIGVGAGLADEFGRDSGLARGGQATQDDEQGRGHTSSLCVTSVGRSARSLPYCVTGPAVHRHRISPVDGF